jgi:hypothetical protein
MYRAQFALPPAPAGFRWQPCVYQFDRTNTPAFASVVLPTGAESGYIPLHLDKDACFVLLAAKITADGFNVWLFDPWSNPLMDSYINADEFADGTSPAAVLEGPGLEVPAGSVFTIRLQGQ